MIEQVCLSETLLEAVREVFDTMIFMDVSEGTDQDTVVDGNTFLGSITFKGDIEGCFSICLEEACAKAISVNMLCLESPDELAEEDLVDAIGEVANMIMGSMKTRMHSVSPNIELSIPSVVSGRILKANLGESEIKVSTRIKIGDYNADLTFQYRTHA